jgi:acetyltransferase EpsM
MIKIYLYGAGFHGRVLSELMKQDGYKLSGFIDDFSNEKQANGLIIERFDPLVMKNVLISIGSDKTIPYKIKLYNKLLPYRLNYVRFVHSSAKISHSSKISCGVQVFPNAVVNHNAKIGNFCIINTGAIIEHDCVIEDFTSISPGAVLCGCVKVGKGTFIGANSTIINDIKIGSNCIVGAGSVVIEDVPNNTVVVGNPARKIRDNVEST